MHGYFTVAVLFILIINDVYSNQRDRKELCLTCCGRSPCCGCCGLLGCANEIIPVALNQDIQSRAEKTITPNSINKLTPSPINA